MKLPLGKPVLWVRQHWPMLVNGIALLCSLWLAAHFVSAGGLPPSGQAVVIIVLVCMRPMASPDSVTIWRQLLMFLPTQVAAGAAAVAAGSLFWHWPWTVFAFWPIWVILTLLTVFGRRSWCHLRQGAIAAWRMASTFLLWTKALIQRRVAEGDDTAFSGALLASGAAGFYARLNPAVVSDSRILLLPGALWLIIDRLPINRWQSARDCLPRLAAFYVRLAVWMAGAMACLMIADGAPTRAHLAGVTVAAIVLGIFGLGFRRRLSGSENAARTALALLAATLIAPFAGPQVLGSQDAVWYVNVLADFLAQIRADVFPVFTGQSEFLFNGGVFPVRFAPLFQHLGWLLDSLTMRTLSPAALQNGVIIASFFGAAITSYWMVGLIMPEQPWLTAFLSAVYLTCPGVLAVVYYEDLLMTWTTVPWLPVAFGGCLLSLRTPTISTYVLTAWALGLLWLGHPPVAIWSSIGVLVVQCAHLLGLPLRQWPWRPLLLAAGCFAGIFCYPLIAVFLVPVQGNGSSLGYAATDAGAISHFIHQSFPGILVPPVLRPRSLADFQPGWILSALLVLGLVLMVRQRIKWAPLWAAIALPWVLQVLLVPLPGFGSVPWSLLPAALLNPTGQWPMQRFYVIIAATTVLAVALLLSRLDRWGPRSVGIGLSLLGLAWSLYAVTPFLSARDTQRREAAGAADRNAPENRVLTRYAYLVFGRQPAYFSHGHVDPLFENRFIDPTTGAANGGNPHAILHDPACTKTLASGELNASRDGPDLPWRIGPDFRLDPGKRYALEIQLNHPVVEGVLLVNGPGLSRVYALPEYGERLAFGGQPGSGQLLSLFTSGNKPIEVTLQFTPVPANQRVDLPSLGTFRWMEVYPPALPVRVTSWVPYTATVETSAATWLETPRMYQPGFQAVVNGGPVTPARSTEGLVTVPVPEGRSLVVVSYHPPALLRWGYWISLLSLLASMLGLVLAGAVRPALRPPTPIAW